MEQVIFEIVGWLGLAFCIAAFFVNDVIRLRIITLAGCSLLFSYYAYVDVAQGMVSNLAVLAINAGFLIKTASQKRRLQQATE